jgi:hypothetical protein
LLGDEPNKSAATTIAGIRYVETEEQSSELRQGKFSPLKDAPSPTAINSVAALGYGGRQTDR